MIRWIHGWSWLPELLFTSRIERTYTHPRIITVFRCAKWLSRLLITSIGRIWVRQPTSDLWEWITLLYWLPYQKRQEPRTGCYNDEGNLWLDDQLDYSIAGSTLNVQLLVIFVHVHSIPIFIHSGSLSHSFSAFFLRCSPDEFSKKGPAPIVGVVVFPSKPYGIHNERSQLIEVLVLIAWSFFRIFSSALYHTFAKWVSY